MASRFMTDRMRCGRTWRAVWSAQVVEDEARPVVGVSADISGAG